MFKLPMTFYLFTSFSLLTYQSKAVHMQFHSSKWMKSNEKKQNKTHLLNKSSVICCAAKNVSMTKWKLPVKWASGFWIRRVVVEEFVLFLFLGTRRLEITSKFNHQIHLSVNNNCIRYTKNISSVYAVCTSISRCDLFQAIIYYIRISFIINAYWISSTM